MEKAQGQNYCNGMEITQRDVLLCFIKTFWGAFMKTARKIFLWVGLVIVAIAFIACIAISVMDYISEYRHSLEHPDIYKRGLVPVGALSLVNFSLLHIPQLAVALTIIRNGYVFLTPEAPKERIIRCIISTVLAVLVITVHTLITYRFIDLEYAARATFALYLFPAAFIPLALGKKTRAKETDSPTP